MLSESSIGTSVGPFEEDVTASRIRAFIQAVGGRESDIAPPTFLTIFRKGEFALLNDLGIPLSSILHGEQEFFNLKPIMAGDRLRYSTRLAEMVDKKRMRLLTFETQAEALRGKETVSVGTSRTVIVVRE